MGLRLVSGGVDGGVSGTPRPNDVERQRGPKAILPVGAASVGILSLVVVVQAVAIPLAAASPGWRGPQAVFVGAGMVMVCVAALAIYRRQLAEKVREQANRIYVYTQRHRNEDGSLTIVARVYNGSEAPIWHVEVKPRRDGNSYRSTLSQRLPDVLPAMFEEWEWRVDKANAPYEERYPELLFLDSNERRWRRIGPRLELLEA